MRFLPESWSDHKVCEIAYCIYFHEGLFIRSKTTNSIFSSVTWLRFNLSNFLAWLKFRKHCILSMRIKSKCEKKNGIKILIQATGYRCILLKKKLRCIGWLESLLAITRILYNHLMLIHVLKASISYRQ